MRLSSVSETGVKTGITEQAGFKPLVLRSIC